MLAIFLLIFTFSAYGADTLTAVDIAKSKDYCAPAVRQKHKYHSCSRDPLNFLLIPQNLPIPSLHGSDKRVFTIMENLVGLGHTIHLIPFSTTTAKQTEFDLYLLDELQNVKYPTNKKPLLRFEDPRSKYEYVYYTEVIYI